MIANRWSKCPICGTEGSDISNLGVKLCNPCGTVYSKFGVLVDSGREEELQWA